MRAIGQELRRLAVGRGALVAWSALPQLALSGLGTALAVGLGLLIGLASPVIGALVGAVLTGAILAPAYRAAYRAGAAGGFTDIAPIAGLRAGLGSAAAGAVVAIPLGIVLAVAALPAASTVPPLLAGVSWVASVSVLLLAALVAPFVLRRVALGGWSGLAAVGRGIVEAAAAPGLVLRLGAATVAAMVAAAVAGPAVLLVLTGVLVSIHVVLLDDAPAPAPVQEMP